MTNGSGSGGLQPQVLSGDGVSLVPLEAGDVEDMARLALGPGMQENTLVPSNPDGAFARVWVARYIDGWRDGSKAGFAIRNDAGEFLGFIGLVSVDLEGLQAEVGYAVDEHARGRGVATAAVRTITRWALEDLGLARVEARIGPRNTPSIRTIERCGFVYEGTLRSVPFKEGRLQDLAVYSRLPTDA